MIFQSTSFWRFSSISASAIALITACSGSGSDSEPAVVDPVIDSSAPSISISTPTNEDSVDVTLGTVRVAGVASDNVGVVGVSAQCSLGCSGDISVTGTIDWETTDIELVPGENRIDVTARDAAGNQETDTLIVRFTPPTTVSKTSAIGIPDPNWGQLTPYTEEQPELPADWTEEVIDYFYISPAHPEATDQDNPYGIPSKPRRAMPTSVRGGAVIVLSGRFETPLQVSSDCFESNPCWIIGADDVAIPSTLTIDGSYLFIDDLNFDGGVGGALSIAGNSHHLAIRQSRFTNRAQPASGASGISIRPDRGERIEHVVIYNNHFEDLGDWTTTEDRDFHGVVPSLWDRDSSTELRDVWIMGNFCTHLSGDCVQINAGNWPESYKYLHHIYIGRNVSRENRQTGFGIKQASDVIISQNISSGYNGNGAANAGSAIGYQYEKHNLWIIFNELYDSVYGIRQSDTGDGAPQSDIYILGNLIYDIRPAATNTDYDPGNPWHQGAAIALWHGNSERFIVDNTIYDVYDGVNAIFDGGVDISGNIIAYKDNDPENHFFDLSHPARNDRVTMDRNLFIDEQSESYFSWWSGNSGPITTLARVRELSGGQCENCLADVPANDSIHFLNASTDPEVRDFNLDPLSPAIGRNARHPAYDQFESLYGIDIFVDFEGRLRPSSRHAIGAFEFQQ